MEKRNGAMNRPRPRRIPDGQPPSAPAAATNPPAQHSLLVVGVYLLNKPNNISPIVAELADSRQWQVVQSWAALGEGAVPEELVAVTTMQQQEFLPKFSMLNRLLRNHDLDRFDYILVCDDDISLPEGFLDTYLDLVAAFDLALAQPARTPASYIDHYFVAQLKGIRGRQTRYVEIGPLFSLRRDIYADLLPFPEESAMGWGYDFVWPCVIENRGRKMGIIDATPVGHCLRKPVSYYQHREAEQAMKQYLLPRHHVTPGEAFRILESYA